jgi:hypothetical protein
MMRHRRVLLFVLGLLSAATVVAQNGMRAVSVDAHLLVFDREAAAIELTDWVESVDGYFTLRSSDRVEMRVPMERVSELRVVLYERADMVVEYNPQTQDLRQEIATLRAGIQSREEALERIMGYIDAADAASTLALERELTSLLTELESLQGRLYARLNDTRFAWVGIVLATRQKSIPQQIPSSFDWINRVGLYSFLKEVR